MTKGTKKGKRKKINIKKIIRNILILIIICIVMVIFHNKNNNSDVAQNLLIIDNKDVTSEIQDEIIIQNGIVYLSFDDVKNQLDEDIYVEEQTNLIVTFSNKKVATLTLDSSNVEINYSNTSIDGQAFKNENGKIYIPISELENVYNMEFNYYSEANNIIIDYYYKTLMKAYASRATAVKQDTSIFSSTIDRVEKDDWVVVAEDDLNLSSLSEKKWIKVRTQNGIIGYIKSKNLKDYTTEREDMEQDDILDQEDILEKDISKENIENYEKRKTIIQDILQDAILGEYDAVKIINESESEGYSKFKLEIQPILEECGIDTIF